MKKLPTLLLLLLIIPSTFAQSLTVSPGWSATIPASTITEAGLNFTTTTVTSAASQSLMDVNAGKNLIYIIYVQKTDISWDSNLAIWLRRSGNGSGSNGSTIRNGSTFQQITNSPTYFFDLTMGVGKNYTNIPIQYQISGLSVLIPAKNYTTTLLFTITN